MAKRATRASIRLVHWNEDEAAERIERLRGAGFPSVAAASVTAR